VDVLSANVRLLDSGIIRITDSWMDETISDAEVLIGERLQQLITVFFLEYECG